MNSRQRHRESETDRQTDRQTREGERELQTDRDRVDVSRINYFVSTFTRFCHSSQTLTPASHTYSQIGENNNRIKIKQPTGGTF